MGEYVYDVFVSYRHKPPVLDWIKNHFYPLLEQWLPNALPVGHAAKIFVDWEAIETGAAWPAKLQQALKCSRCLLPVWSPEYFRSHWCLAEWQTMLARERQLGMRTVELAEGLIYPVTFFDGEHFPPEARDCQQKDLCCWNSPHSVFRATADYVEFDRQVQALVQELAQMIQRAPAWQDWPVILPEAPLAQGTVKLPRL
jgi:hypothetical protein